MAKRPVITYISFLEKIWGWGEKLPKSSLNNRFRCFSWGKESLLCDWANQINLSVLSLAVKRGSQPDGS